MDPENQNHTAVEIINWYSEKKLAELLLKVPKYLANAKCCDSMEKKLMPTKSQRLLCEFEVSNLLQPPQDWLIL